MGSVRPTVLGGDFGGAFEALGGLFTTAGLLERNPGPDLECEVRRRGIRAGHQPLEPVISLRQRDIRGLGRFGARFRESPGGRTETGVDQRVDRFVERLRVDPEGLLDDLDGAQPLPVALEHRQDGVKPVFALDVFEHQGGMKV